MDRQSCSTGYDLIKAFYGGFKASMYNLFAGFYGGDLKSKYDPRFNREDALTERIIYLIEHNQLEEPNSHSSEIEGKSLTEKENKRMVDTNVLD